MNLEILKNELLDELENNLLPFWSSLKDSKNGGFISKVDFSLKKDYFSEKGCILNSRILWFFSEAYQLLEREELKDLADYAYAFLINKCIDKKNGGIYWSVDYKGDILDDSKHTYNQGFAIYALSSYYRATKNQKALDLAFEIFNLVESKCKDNQGYLESFTVDFQPTSNEKLSENGIIAERTMNTILHLFEGYSLLFEISKDKRVEDRLVEIGKTWYEKVYNNSFPRQEVFFDKNYNSILNATSYGHDIETSWLLDHGIRNLSDEVLKKKINKANEKLCKMVYDLAFQNNCVINESVNDCEDETRVWWIQAESMLGFYNQYEKTNEKKYLEAVFDIWEYIKKYMRDNREKSEWFWDLDKYNKPSSKKDFVEPWKCPYHNGRMCIYLIRRISSL